MDINLETVLLVLLIILPVAYFLWRNRRLEPQVQQSLDERREEYVQKMTAQYGEPEQSLWTAFIRLSHRRRNLSGDSAHSSARP